MLKSIANQQMILKFLINSFIKDLTLDNFKEYLATLKKWNRKEQLQKLNEKLKNENDINEKMAIIKEITKLKREV